MKKIFFFLLLAFASVSLKAQKNDSVTITNDIFTAVEHEPEYPGGMNEFYKYLAQTIRYPAEDRKNRVQGKVFISFIVEKDGSLSDIKAMRAPSASLGAEGIRVVSGSPKWIPGTQNGKKVRVQYTVPISFKLNI